jgi:predicted DNA-binding antitoxin AbrB/MazE fold protein
MQTSVEAVYEKGLFRPLGEIALPEGQHVQLSVWPLTEAAKVQHDPAFNLAELAEDLGLTDLASNIDHYLYGLPKRSE